MDSVKEIVIEHTFFTVSLQTAILSRCRGFLLITEPENAIISTVKTNLTKPETTYCENILISSRPIIPITYIYSYVATSMPKSIWQNRHRVARRSTRFMQDGHFFILGKHQTIRHPIRPIKSPMKNHITGFLPF